MKLSNDDLIAKLARALNVDEKQAGTELYQWTESILKKVSERGNCTVSGLGKFELKEGKLAFSPERELEIEINYKYAGMEPIEIQPAAGRGKTETPPAGKIEKPEEASEENVFSDDDDVYAGEETGTEPSKTDESEKTEVPEKPGESGKEEEFDPFGDEASLSGPPEFTDTPDEDLPDRGKEKTPESQEDPWGELESETTSDQPGDSAVGEKEQRETEPDLTTGKEDSPGEEKKPADKHLSESPSPPLSGSQRRSMRFGDESQKQAARSSVGKKKSKKSRKTPESKLWMLPIAAAFIVAILLFLHFDGQIMDRRYQAERPAAEVPVTTAPEDESGLPEHRIEPVPEDAATPDEDLAPEVDAVPEAEDPGSHLGLMGPEEEVLLGAYTIVVHSIGNENRARVEHERYADDGYKATISRVQSANGSTTWRVGLGQFETVSDAEDAISDLPEPYRSNNFIARIR